MSIAMYICCSMCGRDIYKPLELMKFRREDYAEHMTDFYVVNENGKQDELCPKCYKAWLSLKQGENT